MLDYYKNWFDSEMDKCTDLTLRLKNFIKSEQLKVR
jgi:hypothetical protein